MKVIEKKKIENIHEEQPPTLHKEEKLKYQLSFIDDLYATTPYMGLGGISRTSMWCRTKSSVKISPMSWDTMLSTQTSSWES